MKKQQDYNMCLCLDHDKSEDKNRKFVHKCIIWGKRKNTSL